MTTPVRAAVVVLSVVLSVVLGLGAGPGMAGPVTASGGTSAKPKPQRPTVAEVSPASGSIAGGTTVTIKGRNLAGVTKVRFGRVNSTSITLRSARKLTVVAPAHGPGAVNVRVVVEGRRSKKGITFRYFAPSQSEPPAPPAPSSTEPTVTGASPSSGSVAGGTVVTVTGIHLSGATAVTFGGEPGTALQAVSPTSLQVTTPTYTPGLVGIRVTTPEGTSSVGEGNTFTYTGTTPGLPTAPPPPGGTGPDLAAVDCAADDVCVAVGSYWNTGSVFPLAESYVDGVWIPDSPQLPDDGDQAAPGGHLDDVDCVSASFCAAVGSYRYESTTGVWRPFVATWNGSSWTSVAVAQPAALLRTVSCASATFCVAVGEYDNGGPSPSGRALAVRFDGTSWTTETLPEADDTLSMSLVDVSCHVADECVAVGSRRRPLQLPHTVGLVLILAHSTWSFGPSNLPPNAAATGHGGSLTEVDCEGLSCSAIGVYHSDPGGLWHSAYAISHTLGAGWTAPSEIQFPEGSFGVDVGGLECAAAGSCTAMGSYLRIDAPAWVAQLTAGVGVLSTPTVFGADSNLSVEVHGVACAGASTCLGVGEFSGAPDYSRGYYGLLLPSGSQGTVSETGPGAWITELSDVAVANATTGEFVAVGSYSNETGIHGLLLDGLMGL